ncbi:kinase-like protein [Microthyrium microscopicum]|uniref:non-specific serine/threonine protein kinase n=1 Tax=Microthyrium microscopicum TaxID=703497 RepID=A0A6A6U7A8_9PEZI|nr:kinase-like protein [Microthyrium microscopicum]
MESVWGDYGDLWNFGRAYTTHEPAQMTVLEERPRHALRLSIEESQRSILHSIEEEIAWDMMKQLLQGLAFLHVGLREDGTVIPGWSPILHFDIKPNNIFVYCRPKAEAGKSNLRFVIADFGLADFKGAELYLPSTTQYLAPEYARDRTAGECSDVFALACSFHEVLSGFPARYKAHDLMSAIHQRVVDHFTREKAQLLQPLNLVPIDSPLNHRQHFVNGHYYSNTTHDLPASYGMFGTNFRPREYSSALSYHMMLLFGDIEVENEIPKRPTAQEALSSLETTMGQIEKYASDNGFTFTEAAMDWDRKNDDLRNLQRNHMVKNQIESAKLYRWLRIHQISFGGNANVGMITPELICPSYTYYTEHYAPSAEIIWGKSQTLPAGLPHPVSGQYQDEYDPHKRRGISARLSMSPSPPANAVGGQTTTNTVRNLAPGQDGNGGGQEQDEVRPSTEHADETDGFTPQAGKGPAIDPQLVQIQPAAPGPLGQQVAGAAPQPDARHHGGTTPSNRPPYSPLSPPVL